MEHRLHLSLLYVFSSIVICKFLFGDWLQAVLWSEWIWSKASLLFHWLFLVIFSRPIIVGFILSVISLNITYMTSNIPGVDPPSPFSPVKYRRQSGKDWHLNYACAALIGPFIAILLFIGY